MFPAPRGRETHTGAGGRGFLKVRREGAPTTTRQAEVLNTAIIGSPGDERGVVIGTDQLSAAMVAHDPFTAYETGTITSPNVCVLGMIGVGKSSLIKTVYVERPLMLRRRRAVVVDKKLRGGEGEYAELTRWFGAEPFRFDPDTPDRLHLHERAGPGHPGRRRPRRPTPAPVRGRRAGRRRPAGRVAPRRAHPGLPGHHAHLRGPAPGAGDPGPDRADPHRGQRPGVRRACGRRRWI